MPLTLEQKRRILQNAGINPDSGAQVFDDPLEAANAQLQQQQGVVPPVVPNVTTDPSNSPSGVEQKPTTSALGASLAHAGGSLLPTMGALGLGAAAAGLAPFTGGTSLLVPTLLGLGGAAVGGGATSWLQNKLMPPVAQQYLQQSQQEHPIASGIGDIAPSALFFNPIEGVKNIPKMGKTLGRIATTHSPEMISTAERALLGNAAINVGGNVGMDAVHQGMSDQPYSVKQAALAGLEGLLFSEPTGLGKKVFGFHGSQELPAKPGREVTGDIEQQQRQTVANEVQQKLAAQDAQQQNVSAFSREPLREIKRKNGKASGFVERPDAMKDFAASEDTTPPDISLHENEGGNVQQDLKKAAIEANKEDLAETIEAEKQRIIRRDAFEKAQAELHQQQIEDIKLSAEELRLKNEQRKLDLAVGGKSGVGQEAPVAERLQQKIEAPRLAQPEIKPDVNIGKELNVAKKQKQQLQELQKPLTEAERIQDEYDRGIRNQPESEKKGTDNPEEQRNY
jgi:hypothetical protein